MIRSPISRRLFLSAASTVLSCLKAYAIDGKIDDRGIGGTGRPQNGDDRGIGGTGIRGTITGFGSILVNDRRIIYPPDLEVEFANRIGTASDLKIGHVIRTVANPHGSDLRSTKVIVEYEVIGKVDRLSDDKYTIWVLEQEVVITGQPIPVVGTRVAISGLRRPDGVIVANLIEPAGKAQDQVTGYISRSLFWQPSLNGLTLAGPLPDGIMDRARLTGNLLPSGFEITHAENAPLLHFNHPVDHLLIEAFATSDFFGLHMDQGVTVPTSDQLTMAAAAKRVVVELHVNNHNYTTVSANPIQPSPVPATTVGSPPTTVTAPAPSATAPTANVTNPAGKASPTQPPSKSKPKSY